VSLKRNERPLALFFADAHLDTGAWTNRPRLHGDSLNAFAYICNYAVENQIPHMFGAGDLIDIKKPPPEIVQFARTQLSKLEEADCRFYFIQGQHEYSPDMPWFSAIHNWPQWLNHRTVNIGDYFVYGMDWRPGDKLAYALTTIPAQIDIMLMHQVWEEFMGSTRGCEGSFSQIPTAHTIFTGDFHVNKELDSLRGADGQELFVISPGSTNLRSISEDTDKYFYTLGTDGVWTRHQIPTRRKFEVTIQAAKDISGFESRFPVLLQKAKDETDNLDLPEDLARPLCRVIYVDDVPDVYQTIRKLAGDDVELFLKPIPAAMPDAVSVERKAFDEKSAAGLLGMLEAVMPKTDKRFPILSRLLAPNADMKVELQRMKKERGLT
jgi:hypothetical protein